MSPDAFKQERMTAMETFKLYIYRKSDGRKHRGIETEFRDTEHEMTLLWQTVRNLTKKPDVCEIRVTDGWDDMIIHWDDVQGLIFPDVSDDVRESLDPSKIKERF